MSVGNQERASLVLPSVGCVKQRWGEEQANMVENEQSTVTTGSQQNTPGDEIPTGRKSYSDAVANKHIFNISAEETFMIEHCSQSSPSEPNGLYLPVHIY